MADRVGRANCGRSEQRRDHSASTVFQGGGRKERRCRPRSRSSGPYPRRAGRPLVVSDAATADCSSCEDTKHAVCRRCRCGKRWAAAGPMAERRRTLAPNPRRQSPPTGHAGSAADPLRGPRHGDDSRWPPRFSTRSVMPMREAARQLRIPPSTLQPWLECGERRNTSYTPVLRPRARGTLEMTWGKWSRRGTCARTAPGRPCSTSGRSSARCARSSGSHTPWRTSSRS